MEKERYDNMTEPVLIQRHTNERGERFVGVKVAVNAAFVDDEKHPYWEADTNFFWVPEGAIDLEAVAANPAAYLSYVYISPEALRDAKIEARTEAQDMLDALRDGFPIIPIPSYREGAAVCNRTSDQVKLIAGLSMGGLPYYELANGEIVNLSETDIKAIAADVTAAETAWQQGKQACWHAIEEATSETDIAAALEAFNTLLAPYRKTEEGA